MLVGKEVAKTAGFEHGVDKGALRRDHPGFFPDQIGHGDFRPSRRWRLVAQVAVDGANQFLRFNSSIHQSSDGADHFQSFFNGGDIAQPGRMFVPQLVNGLGGVFLFVAKDQIRS